MGKISVGSLAKTLGIEPREAITRLKEIGVDAKTATSQVDEDVVARLTVPQSKDNGTNEVRVASNVIRRRAKVVPADEMIEIPVPVTVVESPPVQPAALQPQTPSFPLPSPVVPLPVEPKAVIIAAAPVLTVVVEAKRPLLLQHLLRYQCRQ